MTVDEKIRNALLPFDVPVENTVYFGDAPIYYTFNYNVIASGHGDDDAQEDRYLIQVHLFAPLNVNLTSRIRKTRAALADAGFTVPDVLNQSDENGRHLVFECELAEGVMNG